MMKLRQAFALSLIGLFAVAGTATQTAHAGGYLSIAGAGVLPKNFDFVANGATISATGKLGFGAGILFGNQFSPYWGLESGAIFLHRKVELSLASTVVGTQSFNSVYFPVGIRIFLGRMLSVQAGGFYDQPMDSSVTANYGAQGGVGIKLPISPMAAFFADARYNLGLKDTDRIPGVAVKMSDVVLATVGLTFGGSHK